MSCSFSCSVGFSINPPLDNDLYIPVPTKSKLKDNPKLTWSDGIDPQLMPLSWSSPIKKTVSVQSKSPSSVNPVVPVTSKLHANPNLSWSAGIHPMLQTSFSRYIPLHLDLSNLDGRISTLPGRFESSPENLRNMAKNLNVPDISAEYHEQSFQKQDVKPSFSAHSTTGNQILNKNDKARCVSNFTQVDYVAIEVLLELGSTKGTL